jgi:hypothetical protein
VIKVHRTLAVCWLIIGAASFALSWQDSVVLVWIASVYANVMSSFGAAAATDDRAVLEELRALREKVDAL